MRGFRASSFDHSDVFYADFPKNGTVDRTIGHVDLKDPKGFLTAKVDEGTATEQRGNYLILRKPLGKPNLLDSDISIDVRDVATGKSLWTLKCEKEAPAVVVNSDTNRVVLIWRADDAGAKDEIKSDRNLRNSFNATKEHPGEYFVKVIEADDGRMLGQFTAQAGDLGTEEGGLSVDAFADDDWVAFGDSAGHMGLYSSTSGEKKGEIPGASAVISEPAGLLATKGGSKELDLYSMPDLKKQSQLEFSTPVIFKGFSEDGKQLFVLTADQTTYFFDTAKLGGSSKAATAGSSATK
jgi:hypothetical protein